MSRIERAVGWIVDVDGCLVRTGRGGGAGGCAMPEAAAFLEALERQGQPYVVCTNASESRPEEYARNLRELGLPIKDEHFATAGSVAADYLARHHGGEPVIAVGSEGFVKTLADRGVLLAEREAWRDATAVVVGASQHYDVTWISAGALAAEAGARLYTCVRDPWFHGGIAKSVSSASVIAAGISWTSGVPAEVLGKPSRALGLTLAENMGVDPSDVVVVGDASAEVVLARAIGGSSYLLLSGATDQEAAAEHVGADETVRGVFADIAELHQHLITTRNPASTDRQRHE